jgi:hypothetical protein
LVWHVDDSLAFKNGGEKLSNDHDIYVCTTMLIFRLVTPALAPAAPRGAAGQGTLCQIYIRTLLFARTSFACTRANEMPSFGYSTILSSLP